MKALPAPPPAVDYLKGQTSWGMMACFTAILNLVLVSRAIPSRGARCFLIAANTAIDGINPADINKAFEDAKTHLSNKVDGVKQALAQRITSEVDYNNQKSDELLAQGKKMKEDAFATLQNIQTQQHKLEVAAAQRLSEITQKQAEYTSLLN